MNELVLNLALAILFAEGSAVAAAGMAAALVPGNAAARRWHGRGGFLPGAGDGVLGCFNHGRGVVNLMEFEDFAAPDGTRYRFDGPQNVIKRCLKGQMGWSFLAKKESPAALAAEWERLKNRVAAQTGARVESAATQGDEMKGNADVLKERINMVHVDSIQCGENFLPGLAVSDFEALRGAIARRGIERPLHVKDCGAEGGLRLVDGWHRLAIARELGFVEVPVIFLEVEDEQQHAIECAESNGRQLSQAYKALLAFERYRPEIQRASEEGAGPKIGSTRGVNCAHAQLTAAQPFSINDLEKRRGLRRGDLGTLNKAWSKFCPDNKVTVKWLCVRDFIAAGTGCGAAVAGAAGRDATKEKERNEPRQDLLLVEGARLLAGRLEHLSGVVWNRATKTDLHYWLGQLFAKFPEESRLEAARVIVEHWPEQERAELCKRLKAELGGVK